MTDSQVKQADTTPGEAYWQLHGMHCDPFADEGDNGWYYADAEREELLHSALRMARFATHVAVFAGTQGVGKSKLLDTLAARLEGVSFVLRLQGGFMLTVEQLFGQIGDALGLQAAELEPVELRTQILRHLEHGLPHSKSFIVLVDDAHELPDHTLTSLLALAQDDGNSVKLLLFAVTDANGDLRAELDCDAIQRVDITPLNLNGVEQYLRYRLTMAGYAGPFPFTEADVLNVFQYSGGIPEHMHDMAEQKLRAALAEQPPATTPASLRIPWLHVAASVVLVIFIAALWSAGEDDSVSVETRLKIPPADSVEAVSAPKRPITVAPETVARKPVTESEQGETAPQPAVKEEQPEPTADPGVAATEPAAIEQPDSEAREAASKKPPAETAPSQAKTAAAEAPAEPRVTNPVKAVEASANIYTDNERYLLDLPASHYTLQLVGSKSLQGVQDFAKRHKGTSIIVFRQLLNNKPWYVAVTGDYPNQEQATTALARLPKPLRDLKPWARPLSKVQGDILAAGDGRE